MAYGFLAEALRRSGLLGDLGRQAAGLGDAALSVGSSVAGQIPAGVNGLLTLAATGDTDKAAEEVERSMQSLQYQPRTQEGREHLARLGGAVESASNYVANTRAGRALNEGIDVAATHAPAAAAIATGLLGVMGTKGVGTGGRALGSTAARQAGHVGVKTGGLLPNAARVEFPKDLYHGARTKFSKFRNTYLGSGQNPTTAVGHFFSADKRVAQEYADFSETGRVVKVTTDVKNPALIDARNIPGGWLSGGDEEIARLLRAAKKNGHDGAVIVDWADGTAADRQYVVFDSSKIKIDNSVSPNLLSNSPPATGPAILNIGHKVGDVIELTPKRIEAALKKRGIKAKSHQVRDSGTEPTSIIVPDRALTPAEAHEISVELKQDAIAQKVGDSGELYGPKASEWGPFNQEYFLESEAPYAKFAEEYPPVGPPEMKLDKKKGTMYPAKSYTDEGRDFLRQRLVAQRDIDEGNYEPFFDPAKRHDANLLNHPTDVDTYTQGLPAKQATVDKWRKAVQTDEARARLQEAFDAGKASGGHDAWYKMGQLEKEFIDELGPEEGPRMFRERFANAMSSTTSGATPEANLLMAHYGNFLRQRGQRAPEAGYQLPPAVGNQNAGSNMALFNKQINDGEGLGVGAPKRHNFTRNFLGDSSHSTVDAQMTDLITPGKSAPEGDSYFAYEELIREMAEKNGVDPRDFQDVAWGGKKFLTTGGKYRGKPMIEIVNEAIERTHRLTGMPKAEIVRRGLVRGEIPLYGMGGAAAGLGLLGMQSEDDGA